MLKPKWVAFTLDDTIALGHSRQMCVLNLHARVLKLSAGRRIRAGLYEYQSSSDTRTRTFYVATMAEAVREGWDIRNGVQR